MFMNAPGKDDDARRGNGPLRGASVGKRQIRVLLVDDNEDAVEMLAMLLVRHDLDVEVAFDGKTALEKALDGDFDAICLDIGLPRMDGYEVARRLNAHRGNGKSRPTLVALTGYGTETDRARAFAVGFDEHLVKPVEPERLVEALCASYD